MTRGEVTKRFDLQGRDERDLARRLDTLRQAVNAQNGVILDVTWSATEPRRASVVYCIPDLMMTG